MKNEDIVLKDLFLEWKFELTMNRVCIYIDIENFILIRHVNNIIT